MRDVNRFLCPGLHLYITPSGWYTLEWNLPAGRTMNLELAIKNLKTLIEHGNLPPAGEMRRYEYDDYRTAEEVLDDFLVYVKGHALNLLQLEELDTSDELGAPIWVKDLEHGFVYAAVTDMMEADGIIAVWSVNRWFKEDDYGKTWLAYIIKPE